MRRMALPAVRRPAEHPRRRDAGAGAPAGQGHAGSLAEALLELLRRRRRAAPADRAASARSTPACARTPREKAADAVLEVMRRRPCAEAWSAASTKRAGARWPGRVRRRGDPRPGAPIAGLRDSKLLSAAAPRAARRAHPGARRRLGGRLRQRRGNRPPEHPAGDPARHAARRRGAERAAGRSLDRRQPLPDARLPRARHRAAATALHPAISAASILAKTARDAEMLRLHERYPQYGFDRHKGYPTPEHLALLARARRRATSTAAASRRCGVSCSRA